jgi:hypothetical protein
LHEESLALFRELGDKRSIAISLNNLGTVAQEQEDYDTARTSFKESLALCREVGDKVGIISSLAGLGGLAVITRVRGVEGGTMLLGAVEALSRSMGGVLDVIDRMLLERNMARARVQLGDVKFRKAWAEGQAMSMAQAVEYAQEHIGE